MSNQRGAAQRLSATPSDEISHLQSEMARLAAHVARLTAQQTAPPPRNLTSSMTLSMHVQNAGDCLSGAHLQMCSYHRPCTHNDANCWAQHLKSASPINAATNRASHCYFCRMRVHLTDRCKRPCLHSGTLRVHRARACPNRILTLPAAAVVSAPTPLSALLLPPLKYARLVNINPSTTQKRTGNISLIASYRPTEDTLAPPDHFIAQGPMPGSPTDSPLEVVGQLESMNLMAALWILGPKVARRVLKFIADGIICATQVDKILLNSEPLSSAVIAVSRAVEEVSGNTRPTAVVAASPSTTTTGAQTQMAIAQQQPVANAFEETLHAFNNDISIIEASPFPMATPPWSTKIGVLHEVHPCRGLVIDFPGEDLVSSDDDNKE
uniref:Uncharacterized protein n=1 Tax=Romanomermis culicivorax TaxID=13658 RepID=A0A915KHY0_ROMCU